MDVRDAMAVDSVEQSPVEEPVHIDLTRETSHDLYGTPRRDSKEDADPTLTRKRQRLDSSAHRSRSMSAEGAFVTSSPNAVYQSLESPDVLDGPSPTDVTTKNPDHSDDSPLPDADTAAGLEAEVMAGTEPATDSRPRPRTPPHNGASPHKRTASKVTINVRTPRKDTSDNSTDWSNSTHTIESLHTELPLTQDPTHDTADGRLDDHGAADSHKDRSVTSSPSHSPEVEVAEIEDMDNDYNGSGGWAPLVSVVAAARLETFVEKFPFYHDGCDPRALVMHIMKALERGEPANGAVLSELRDWLCYCVDRADERGLDWFVIFSEQHDFWDEIPGLIEALLRRRIPFQNQLSRDPPPAEEDEEHLLLEGLFIQYARLTQRLIAVDVAALEQSEDTKEEPELVSTRYQTMLSWLLTASPADVMLWQVLQKFYQYDVDDTCATISLRFAGSPENGLILISNYARLILRRVPQFQKFFAFCWTPVLVVQKLVGNAIDRISTIPTDDDGLSDEWARITQDAALLGKSLYEELQVVVEKQVPIPREFIREACCHLSQLFFDIAQADREVAHKLFVAKEGPNELVRDDDLPQLVMRSWKLNLLKKCIINGRMEVRAQGLEYLCDELLEAWNKYGAKGINHPVMQYLAQFILKNNFVEYLVGVDSHLHLMERSTNVVGFLVVTHKYTAKETDTLWRTARTSQDPRAVVAVLNVLKSILSLAQYPSLIYLCEKLNELPLESFDTAMIAYATSLLSVTRDKFRTLHQQKLDIQPFDFCIQITRMATSPENGNLQGANAVAGFALNQLSDLLVYGPEPEERKRIYLECVNDIREKNSNVTGSICVINTLINQTYTISDMSGDLEMLTSKLDLTRLLIEELADFESKHAAGNHYSAIRPRLDILAQVIHCAPSTVTPELGKMFWDCLFGTPNPLIRDAAWVMLGNVVDRSRVRNDFIDRCISEYLPLLSPKSFTSNVLVFTQRAIQYEHRLTPLQTPSEHEFMQIVGSEQVWRIVLSAPYNTVERQAIQVLVELYLSDPMIQEAPKSAVEATHLALVDRCIQQLTSAATKMKAFSDGTMSGEDEPMIIVASDDEIRTEEIRFSRSLLLLTEFLRGIRTRKYHSAKDHRKSEPGPSSPFTEELIGDLMVIRYQAHTGHNRQPPTQSIEVGDLETCEQFKQRLSNATGFSDFKAYYAGRRMELDENLSSTLRDMNLGENPVIMINQIHHVGEVQPGVSNSGLTAVEVELLKHFDQIYDLLSLEQRFATEIWDFLNTFPPQERVRRVIMAADSNLAEIFPSGEPFKIIYSTRTLWSCLDDQLQIVGAMRSVEQNTNLIDIRQGIADEDFISRNIRHIIAALTKEDLLEGVSDPHLKIQVLGRLVSCLLRFLKEPVAETTSAGYFGDEAALVNCFMLLLHATRSTETWSFEEATTLAADTFSAILESSLHSSTIWKTFTSRQETSSVIQHLILDDMRAQLREHVAEAIASICKSTPAASKVTAVEFAEYFWPVLSAILPQTRSRQTNSAQLFRATLSVFRVIGELRDASLDHNQYLREWGDLLVNHKHQEVVGRDSVDHFVYGFTKLLYWCLQLARSYKRPVDTGDLALDVFNTCLFPDLSPWTTEESIVERVPVLHSPTRHELNQLILLLSQDLKGYEMVLSHVSELVAETPTDSRVWDFQRSKSIRSPTGYVGLHNLSNTCYLNSLFTQLFMNVEFRGFMLNANVADADGSQRLLSETQKLFAHMQDSWQVAVEPKELTGAIRTYENENIDVTVQMDVDEFYNLLFDRWEGQILSDNAKKIFRSFYGGQLVQQVKSKECPHVSEREEPFSAIQCDIKGKATLQDSLQAYVEGDVMEGDNKYSCTSCGRHVDAVKRTCLKEVPDNLIFHLKRFDFDLRHMQRSKINDRFVFPDTIDMKPYTVEHLSEPASPVPEDTFELVGVLVHSGTAESGHYYSFIRERPITSMSQTPGWVQFNDSDVTPWDPTNMEGQCFGGMETWPATRDNHPLLLPKAYSAYMLFYQRQSAISSEQQRQTSFDNDSPKKLPVPLELRNHIACENEIFIRKYCLYDPFHAPFVKSLLDSLHHVNKGGCSDSHETEKMAIELTLHHLDQVIARTKDFPNFESTLQSLMKVMGSCPNCCKVGLDWITCNTEAMRHLLLRNPNLKVRQEFVRLLINSLAYLREKDEEMYGIDVHGTKYASIVECNGAFHDILDRLDNFWGVIEQHMRAWDDYFALLAHMASLGSIEASLILQRGFLRRCLEILVAEFSPPLRAEYDRMIRLLSKGRKISISKLLELVRILMGRIQLNAEPRPFDETNRLPINGLDLWPATRVEEEYFHLHLRQHRTLVFVTKMLDTNHNPLAAKAIIAQLMDAEPEFGLSSLMHKTLTAGIAIDPASLAGPYLQAAITFCEHAPNTQEVTDIISRTAREVDTIGSSGGREHLIFFRQAAFARNPRITQGSWGPHFFHLKVLSAAQYWAPVLLAYYEVNVREETEALLEKLIFQYGYPVTSGTDRLDDTIERCARDLGEACLAKIQEKWIAGNIQTEANSVESITRIIDRCNDYFDASEDSDYLSKSETILTQLRELLVDELDEPGSDEWDNDSNLGSETSDMDPNCPPMDVAAL